MAIEPAGAAIAIGVKALDTSALYPNPHNPRLLFDRADMHVLEQSIKRVGILVPLTVYKEARSAKYFILDGQRRWICAQKVGLKKVPVNEVSEPTLIQNIVTMFQIHKLRKDWELMPTALKLELLMEELHERGEKRLADLTGLDEAVVSRCKKLLSYSRRYQDLMLDPEPEKRVKADFFIELYAVRNDRAVNKMDWFKKDKFTDAMLRKLAAKGLRSVTEFRVVKQHINNAVKANKLTQISKKLEQFSDNPKLPADHLNIASAAAASSARQILKLAVTLQEHVTTLPIDVYVGEQDMWQGLDVLATTIRKRLVQMGWRLDQ